MGSSVEKMGSKTLPCAEPTLQSCQGLRIEMSETFPQAGHGDRIVWHWLSVKGGRGYIRDQNGFRSKSLKSRGCAGECTFIKWTLNNTPFCRGPDIRGCTLCILVPFWAFLLQYHHPIPSKKSYQMYTDLKNGPGHQKV